MSDDNRTTDALRLGIVFLLLAPIAILQAWVLQWGWSWFITPVFAWEAPRLPYIIGMVTMISLTRPNKKSKESIKDLLHATLTKIFECFIVLGILWLVHLFV